MCGQPPFFSVGHLHFGQFFVFNLSQLSDNSSKSSIPPNNEIHFLYKLHDIGL